MSAILYLKKMYELYEFFFNILSIFITMIM